MLLYSNHSILLVATNFLLCLIDESNITTDKNGNKESINGIWHCLWFEASIGEGAWRGGAAAMYTLSTGCYMSVGCGNSLLLGTPPSVSCDHSTLLASPDVSTLSPSHSWGGKKDTSLSQGRHILRSDVCDHPKLPVVILAVAVQTHKLAFSCVRDGAIPQHLIMVRV